MISPRCVPTSNRVAEAEVTFRWPWLKVPGLASPPSSLPISGVSSYGGEKYPGVVRVGFLLAGDGPSGSGGRIGEEHPPLGRPQHHPLAVEIGVLLCPSNALVRLLFAKPCIHGHPPIPLCCFSSSASARSVIRPDGATGWRSSAASALSEARHTSSGDAAPRTFAMLGRRAHPHHQPLSSIPKTDCDLAAWESAAWENLNSVRPLG